MNLSLQLKVSLIIFFLAFLSFVRVDAAMLELNLEKDIASYKEDVVVLVTINSEEQDINTAQAVITFPKTLLEVMNIDTTDSVFSFWLENPSYDNSKGEISFTGGATSGFNGLALKLMKISFKVKGSGVGQLSINNGAITLSDGTGTNVYNTSKGLNITIPTSSEFESVKLEKAKQATTLAQKLPSKPSINIPFYPDQTMWNNRSASFNVGWNYTTDISKVGISIDKNPNSTPDFIADAFLGNKIFPALSDGIWYLHIRFKNNVGWGPTLHYRLAIDTTPPNSFKILSDNDFVTSNPKPTIDFTSSDLVSGIKNYIINLDGVINTTNLTTYTFSPLLPGVHKLVVSAVDNAGNSTSQIESLEILPITAPVIAYVSDKIIINEEKITAGGTSISKGDIIIQIENSKKQIVAEQTTKVDSNGNWNIVIDKDLSIGSYHLIATIRDENMASSFPVVSNVITVKLKPVLVLGKLEINQPVFFIILILILLCSFGAGLFTYKKWRGQLGKKVIIAERDVINMFNALDNDINKLNTYCSEDDINNIKIEEIKVILKNMKNNLEKSHHFVVDNIKEIDK